MEETIARVDTEKIEKLSLVGGFIFTIISGVYYISNYVFNQICKQNSQKYYGIPSKYFKGSIEDTAFYLALLIILIGIIFGLPLYVKFMKNRTYKFSNILTGFVSLIMGLVFSFLNIKYLQDIIVIMDSNGILIFVSKHIVKISMIITIFSVMAVECFTYMNEIESKLNNKFKKYFDIFIIGMLSFFVFLLVAAISVKFFYNNVENKTVYETTIYEDKNMAILSDLDDKVLIVEYEINENKETMLKTYNYMIVDKENLVISYKDLGEKIIVVKEKNV